MRSGRRAQLFIVSVCALGVVSCTNPTTSVPKACEPGSNDPKCNSLKPNATTGETTATAPTNETTAGSPPSTNAGTGATPPATSEGTGGTVQTNTETNETNGTGGTGAPIGGGGGGEGTGSTPSHVGATGEGGGGSNAGGGQGSEGVSRDPTQQCPGAAIDALEKCDKSAAVERRECFKSVPQDALHLCIGAVKTVDPNTLTPADFQQYRAAICDPRGLSFDQCRSLIARQKTKDTRSDCVRGLEVGGPWFQSILAGRTNVRCDNMYECCQGLEQRERHVCQAEFEIDLAHCQNVKWR